jgi:hypothetical protein
MDCVVCLLLVIYQGPLVLGGNDRIGDILVVGHREPPGGPARYRQAGANELAVFLKVAYGDATGFPAVETEYRITGRIFGAR